MVDKPHLIQDRDFYPSSRPRILPLYGCQSLRMGSSFRADNTVLSWSLDRKPIPAPYQYVRNDGHKISTETSQNIYSPFLHHDIHRQHNGGLIYQQTGWHSFPQSLRRSLENTQLVPGTRHSYQSTSHPRQIQHSCRPPLKTSQTYQDRMGSGSNSCEFSIPDAQLPKCGSVCNKIQPQTPIICLSSTRLQSTSDRCPGHGLESSSCLCFSSFYSDTCCSRENPTTSVQNSSHSSVLATTTVVLRTSSISVSSDSPATNSKTTNSIQRKICPSKPPNSWPSCLGVIKQSIRDKKFSQNVADFVSRSRRASTQKVYDAKWTIFSNWCHTKKVNPISAPITVIADFLIFLFSEKKCQISTIEGYRSVISNTLKFKTGNRIGSNPVLSELIRSFELQRPVQRSLTPKWDLSWVLVCLQKPPFEPLDKASKFHVTIKTAFLLALATAKRCSEIHALAMDSQHLRFNQSDGSVSLIPKSGFLAKNQLPSVKPDPLLFLVLLEYVNGNILIDFFAPLGLWNSISKWLALIAGIELDSFFLLKAIRIFLKILSRDGYLTLLNLPIGNSLNETSLSLKSKLMKLELFPLLGLSSTKFLSMIYFKQRFGIVHQLLPNSISETCLNKHRISKVWAPL